MTVREIADWAALLLAATIVFQLLRTNALLRGIYLILEKQHRPATEQYDLWVAKLECDLREHYPDTLLVPLYLVGALAIFAAYGSFLWWAHK